MLTAPNRRALLLAFLIAALPARAHAQVVGEANACFESEQQTELRAALAKVYGLKRHIKPVPPAVWALETMEPAKHCEVSCRNNAPYDNLYLTYKGFEANGKPCEGETTVVMSSMGLIKLIASCMAGCGAAPAPTPDK